MRVALQTSIIIALLLITGRQVRAQDTNQVPQKVRLEMDLVDGTRLMGSPELELVSLQTVYAKIDIPLNQIFSISIGEDCKTASLSLQNGDDLKGAIDLVPIKLDTIFGHVAVRVEHIKRIRVFVSDSKLSSTTRKDLLLWYSGDEDLGAVINDASGNGRNGRALGAKWTPEGRVGGGYRVGRSLGYIEVPDEDTWSFGTNEFSICLWLKLDSLPQGEAGIVGHNEGGGERNKWMLEFNQGKVDFHINSPRLRGYRIAVYPWLPETGTWHHVSVTRKGNDFTIYVDGESLSTAQVTLPLPFANAPLTIGQSEGLPVEGTIDEIMIFDCALSNQDIQNIYVGGK